MLKSPKCSCTLRTLEREAQTSVLGVRHSDEAGARAGGKGTLDPVEEHLSSFLSVLLEGEMWFI